MFNGWLDDCLRTPEHIKESFHCRVGKPSSERLGLPNNKPTAPRLYGFPVPGPQSPSPASVLAEDYFVRESTWEAILDHGDFDYIVVGSSFMALAFISEAFEINPWSKILCLERGDFWLPSHFQNLPLPFRLVLGGRSETFPWTLSEKTFKDPGVPELKFNYLKGQCPFFGGRSTIWSSWCPQPPLESLRGFPQSMIDTAATGEFWDKAKKLINVTPADEINDGIFDILQKRIDERMVRAIHDVPTARYSESAQLAVGPKSARSTLKHSKYSVPGPLLDVFEKQRLRARNYGRDGYPLEIAINCVVQRLGQVRGGYVRSVETSRGTLSFTGDNTKIILCAGVLPNTTLVLNSFKHLRERAGRRLTGHFLTHVTARCPKAAFNCKKLKKLELAAHYLAGVDEETKLQYHIQITGIHSPHPKEEAEDVARECPDYAAAAAMHQLLGSEDKVVFVCATLGEMDEKNKESYVKLNEELDPTCNVDVQYTFTANDKKLWDVMDKATYDTILALVGPDHEDNVEYWDEMTQKWISDKPDASTIRIPGIVHEASTLFMGDEESGGSVDQNYRLHGTENVYVTGAALFPTAGSWNHTMAMCGYAQDLAKKIVGKSSNGI